MARAKASPPHQTTQEPRPRLRSTQGVTDLLESVFPSDLPLRCREQLC